MAFVPSRPDPALIAGIPFGEAWLALSDPSDRGRCDPFSVSDRMGLYRLLVERCNPHGGLGTDDRMSPFWGYASQLAWQHRSGRLGAASSDAIAPASWWGVCNHALCVVPYAAAMELGAVPTLVFEHRGAAVAPVAAEHARSMDRWCHAIGAMIALRPGDDVEPVRFAVWRAHLTSIETAVRVHRNAFDAMPAAERRFASGWVRMVDLFGACAMRTDLARLSGGDGSLPPRVLADDRVDDLSRHERSTIRRVFALADRPRWRWALELKVWRRMMRTRPARDDSEGVLATLLGKAAGRERIRALRYLI